VDGTGTAASIAGPSGMVVRGNTLTVYDATSVLRQIDLTTRVVTTLTGSRILGPGMADGPVGAARIRDIGGVTGAPNGGFLLADFSALRTVSASGTVRTIANSYATGVTPTGIGTLAQMPMTPSGGGVTVDPAGNVVIADSTALTVRRISPAGAVSLASGRGDQRTARRRGQRGAAPHAEIDRQRRVGRALVHRWLFRAQDRHRQCHDRARGLARHVRQP
jgi:hypothetical protein